MTPKEMILTLMWHMSSRVTLLEINL
jgi:hypothetical protein